jgi:hypothetical protein
MTKYNPALGPNDQEAKVEKRATPKQPSSDKKTSPDELLKATKKSDIELMEEELDKVNAGRATSNPRKCWF